MEKYTRLSEITRNYLHGKLWILNINYNADGAVKISIEYEDNSFYWLDYEMVIDTNRNLVSFLSHHTNGKLSRIDLNRVTEFESAVKEYLLS